MLKPTQDSDGRRPVKAPEQSNFAQTCNLLTQFVKRRGSLKDLNLEVGGKIESLEAILNSRSLRFASDQPESNPRRKKETAQPGTEKRLSTEPFCRLASKGSSNDINVEYASNSPRTSQLTMFYGGRVLVFDDYPEDRARELVALAKKGRSQMSYRIFSSKFPLEKWGTGSKEGLPPRPQASGSRKHAGISSNSRKEKSEADTCDASSSKGSEPGSPLNRATGSDMPIARRSSLHRFLKKRKDRVDGREIQEPGADASSSKVDEYLEMTL
ncbi:protein TIFY 10A [Dorcoceras hygrometricum]|uniref:Protein TIFY n=1 Tax=Dorcoceras hygrometricum TaxID=472368 RepID=A0A2Z7CTV6_9LAMI|nr:protein TIFY 10A [Dorcoceras hygrometricum]